MNFDIDKSMIREVIIHVEKGVPEISVVVAHSEKDMHVDHYGRCYRSGCLIMPITRAQLNEVLDMFEVDNE